jgi:hypothetical protein
LRRRAMDADSIDDFGVGLVLSIVAADAEHGCGRTVWNAPAAGKAIEASDNGNR